MIATLLLGAALGAALTFLILVGLAYLLIRDAEKQASKGPRR